MTSTQEALTPDLTTPPSTAGRLDYVGLTRPGRRWWRLPLSVLIFLTVFVPTAVILTMVFAAVGLAAGWGPGWFIEGVTDPLDISMSPGTLLYSNLVLAALIPATMISTRIGQGIRWGYIHSVAGRFRWALFGQLLVLLLPLWTLFVLVSAAFSGSLTRLDPHPELWAFLAVIWTTTALQCAGEEYAFRGWLLQNLGGLFANRILAWAVPIALSAIVFGVAHGSLDPWVLGGLMTMAVATGVLTWRSGGLEAAIAIHILNNMLVFHLTLIVGGLDDSFVSTDTTGTFPDLIAGIIGYAAAVALAWWWLRRKNVANTTTRDPRALRRSVSS